MKKLNLIFTVSLLVALFTSCGSVKNIAYLMAKHADPSLPDTAEEWLDEFSVFSIYQVLPEIITLWGLNVQTQSVSKKNGPPQSGE